MRSATALVLAAGLAAGCTSSAASQARRLYDAGDFAGAARLADQELAGNTGDEDLWHVRIRALLAQGDRAGVSEAYARYRQQRGSDDTALLTDMATATLGQGLQSTSGDVRVESIGWIERLELEPLAQDVMDQMESDDDRVAAAAAVAVLHGHPQAAYLLEDIQHSSDPVARAIAIQGIGRKVGKHAGDDLRKAMADPEPVVRAAACDALSNLADESSTRSLVEALADPDAVVRTAAARSLAVRGQGDLSGFARIALADPNANVRIAGLALLVAAGDTGGLQALLAGDDPILAVHAAGALAGADPAGAARAIDAALGSTDPQARIGAINLMEAALGRPAAIERARALLPDGEVAVRLAAARLLAYAKLVDEATPVFVAALDSDEQLSAAADLAKLGDPRGTTLLSGAVLDPPKASERAKAALMHGSAHRITPGLVAALADASGQVRVIAAYQLISISRDKQQD
jgi:HEAT repeat protein